MFHEFSLITFKFADFLRFFRRLATVKTDLTVTNKPPSYYVATVMCPAFQYRCASNMQLNDSQWSM